MSAFACTGSLATFRHGAGDRYDHAGMRAVADHGLELVGIDVDDAIELRAWIGLQFAPACDGLVPVGALWGEAAAFEILERLFVRRDHAGACAGFDGHVADGHALFHRERFDGRAAIFDDVAGAAGDADLTDDGEDQILGGDAGAQLCR